MNVGDFVTREPAETSAGIFDILREIFTVSLIRIGTLDSVALGLHYGISVLSGRRVVMVQ